MLRFAQHDTFSLALSNQRFVQTVLIRVQLFED
jgi:hypothetical protein